MYVVRSIVGIASQLGNVAISETILPKIFYDLLPLLLSSIITLNAELVENVSDVKKKSIFSTIIPVNQKPSITPLLAALLEIISLLQGLLPLLSPESIQHYFFHYTMKSSSFLSQQLPPYNSDSDVSLLMLLERLPLPIMLKTDNQTQYDSDDSYDSEVNLEHSQHQISACIEYRQRCNTHIELCKLIANSSTYAGSSTTIDCVLPAIDKFFNQFVNIYDSFDPQSDEMSFAFEIGVELFMPLVQLVGPEGFHTSVPSLNPRLEMWLVSCASGEVGRSPPLPSNIRPATQATEIEEDITPVKDKGFFSWLTSKNTTATPTITSITSSGKDDTIATSTPSSFFSPSKFFSGNDNNSNNNNNNNKEEFSILQKTPKYQENEKNKTNYYHSSSSSNNNNNHNNINHNDDDNDLEELPYTPVTKVRRPSRSISTGLSNINISLSPLGSEKSPEPLFRRPSVSGVFKKLDISRWNEYQSRRSCLDIAKSQFQIGRHTQRRPTVTGSSLPIPSILSGRKDDREDEDEEVIDSFYRDNSWLLGGHGRWNLMKDSRVNSGNNISSTTTLTSTSSPLSKGIGNNLSSMMSMGSPDLTGSKNGPGQKAPKKLGPAAQISMTSPKVAVDTASEATSVFALKMQNKFSWNFDDPSDNHFFQGSNYNNNHNNNNSSSSSSPTSSVGVTLLLPHPTESFFLGGSRDGMIKIWSLNSNPVRLLSSFSEHNSSITSAGYMKNGTQVVSCDGNIHVWDIETSKILSSVSSSSLSSITSNDQEKFSFINVVSPRIGISPDMGLHGDNQIVTCCNSVLSHYDFRQNSYLKPISEWRMLISAQMAATISSNSSDLLSVQLTCSASHDEYVCTGSSAGSIWIIDRRTGKPLHMWQAHDTAVIKVTTICLFIYLFVSTLIFI